MHTVAELRTIDHCHSPRPFQESHFTNHRKTIHRCLQKLRWRILFESAMPSPLPAKLQFKPHPVMHDGGGAASRLLLAAGHAAPGSTIRQAKFTSHRRSRVARAARLIAWDWGRNVVLVVFCYSYVFNHRQHNCWKWHKNRQIALNRDRLGVGSDPPSVFPE